MNEKILTIITVVSFILFLVGIILCSIDINIYGSGLYLSLVAVVVFLVNATACSIGITHDDEESTAKKMWGRIRRRMSLKSSLDKEIIRNTCDKEKLLVGQENFNYINDETERINLSVLYENPLNQIEKLDYNNKNDIDKKEKSIDEKNNEELVAVIWYEDSDENESTFL
uniref:Transmembrane protein n=1 Tax=Strongyloides papillosus TaxID=174720 RepID=A0A0N5BP91_STREA